VRYIVETVDLDIIKKSHDVYKKGKTITVENKYETLRFIYKVSVINTGWDNNREKLRGADYENGSWTEFSDKKAIEVFNKIYESLKI
jgi:hypothetical protein